MRHTKIVATIGPASATKPVLEKMIATGMDVARLNFSHGTHAQHAKLVTAIRSAARARKHTVGLLADLQGPKLRLGAFVEDEIRLKKGDVITLTHEPKRAVSVNGKEKTLPVQFPVFKHVKKGDVVLLRDGMLEARVLSISGKKVSVRVTVGGVVRPHAGVHLPSSRVAIPSITKKDKDDLRFALTQGVDFVALSFVQSAADIIALRRMMKTALGSRVRDEDVPWIVAKIEKPQAIENIDAIIQESDVIMIARGDLGIEMPLADVPIMQKMIAKKCLDAAKPFIVATQMLESMTESPRPTRAEVSDVANAVIDHADAIMLSAESAVGKYPVVAIRMMQKIASETEISPYDDVAQTKGTTVFASRETFAAYALTVARDAGAKVVAVITATGTTARLIARMRSEDARLVALTYRKNTLGRMRVVWGVDALLMPKSQDPDMVTKNALRAIKANRLAKKGDTVVVVMDCRLKNKKMSRFVAVREVR